MHEEWRPIPGYQGAYEVSNLGRVRSVERIIASVRRGKPFARRQPGKVMSPRVNRWGYSQISLGSRHLKGRCISVHKLVALAFIGPRPQPRAQINHKNGVKTDNRVENLEWVTARENSHHAVRNGLVKTGERHSHTRLVEAQVREIRERRRNGERLASIAAAYGICVSAAHAIATGRNWKHLADTSVLEEQ